MNVTYNNKNFLVSMEYFIKQKASKEQLKSLYYSKMDLSVIWQFNNCTNSIGVSCKQNIESIEKIHSERGIKISPLQIKSLVNSYFVGEYVLNSVTTPVFLMENGEYIDYNYIKYDVNYTKNLSLYSEPISLKNMKMGKMYFFVPSTEIVGTEKLQALNKFYDNDIEPLFKKLGQTLHPDFMFQITDNQRKMIKMALFDLNTLITMQEIFNVKSQTVNDATNKKKLGILVGVSEYSRNIPSRYIYLNQEGQFVDKDNHNYWPIYESALRKVFHFNSKKEVDHTPYIVYVFSRIVFESEDANRRGKAFQDAFGFLKPFCEHHPHIIENAYFWDGKKLDNDKGTTTFLQCTFAITLLGFIGYEIAQIVSNADVALTGHEFLHVPSVLASQHQEITHQIHSLKDKISTLKEKMKTDSSSQQKNDLYHKSKDEIIKYALEQNKYSGYTHEHILERSEKIEGDISQIVQHDVNNHLNNDIVKNYEWHYKCLGSWFKFARNKGNAEYDTIDDITNSFLHNTGPVHGINLSSDQFHHFLVDHFASKAPNLDQNDSNLNNENFSEWYGKDLINMSKIEQLITDPNMFFSQYVAEKNDIIEDEIENSLVKTRTVDGIISDRPDVDSEGKPIFKNSQEREVYYNKIATYSIIRDELEDTKSALYKESQKLKRELELHFLHNDISIIKDFIKSTKNELKSFQENVTENDKEIKHLESVLSYGEQYLKERIACEKLAKSKTLKHIDSENLKKDDSLQSMIQLDEQRDKIEEKRDKLEESQ